MPPLRPPPPASVLHLYRQLLREASYLPPVCQPWVCGRIRAQFRQRHELEPDPNLDSRLKKATHYLRALRAANAGDMARMERVLHLVFGRIGLRRVFLNRALLEKEPPANTAAAKAMTPEELAATPPDRYEDWLDKVDLDKLRAFISSQASVRFKSNPRPTIRAKTLDPVIPPENIWGRPWHPYPFRTKQKKFWEKMINRVLPPLPKGEWDVLQGLAEGRLTGPEWDPPPRRTLAKSTFVDGVSPTTAAWNWKAYALRSVRAVERQSSRSLKSFNTTPGTTSQGDEPQAVGIHKLTSRYWRRLYARVWELSATMEKDKTAGKLIINWGGTKKPISKSMRQHPEFFEGISERGKLSQAPKRETLEEPTAA